MTALPEGYLTEMRRLLGSAYPDWENVMEGGGEAVKGLRLNRLKSGYAGALPGLPFTVSPVPWTENGFYLEEDERPALHPYYAAGLYYIQEPSAMLPAAALPVEAGDLVLDLCAAPGGKATELAGKLRGTGLLVANDISAARSNALLKNLELSGAGNILVTCETPERLAGRFAGRFDKILVDAPCSGEGMLRCMPSMASDWETRGPSYYKKLQGDILLQAAGMLAPGGILLYSTCTFSVEENEGNVLKLLRSGYDFEVLPIDGMQDGFEGGRPDLLDADLNSDEERQILNCVRLYPHKIRGEGHFAAMLKKKGDAGGAGRRDGFNTRPYGTPVGRRDDFNARPRGTPVGRGDDFNARPRGTPDGRRDDFNARPRGTPDGWREFSLLMKNPPEKDRLYINKNRIYALPRALEPSDFQGLRVLRTGLLLGEIRGDRFEPSQALAMYLKKDEFTNVIDFSCGDGRVMRYLKGESPDIEDFNPGKGVYLVCVDGLPLGWGKSDGARLKNRYCPGWIRQVG